MNIKLNTQDSTIIEAVELVKKYYAHPDFLLSIAKHGHFNDCPFVGWELANTYLSLAHGVEATVSMVRPWNPWSKMVAETNRNKRTVVFNSRKNFPLMDRVETSWHEIMGHMCGFGHYGNKVNERTLGSFPYKGAEYFRKFVEMQEKRKEVA